MKSSLPLVPVQQWNVVEPFVVQCSVSLESEAPDSHPEFVKDSFEGRPLEVVEGRPQEDVWELVLVPGKDKFFVVVWGKEPVAVE